MYSTPAPFLCLRSSHGTAPIYSFSLHCGSIFYHPPGEKLHPVRGILYLAELEVVYYVLYHIRSLVHERVLHLPYTNTSFNNR